MSKHLTLQQITTSVDDELSGVARELVERHLSSCAGCDAVMERVVRLDAEVLAVIGDEPGEEFFDEMLVVIRGKTEALVEQANAPAKAVSKSALGAAPLAPSAAAARPKPAAPVAAVAAGATRTAGPVGASARAGASPPRVPIKPVPAHRPPGRESAGSRFARAWIAALGVLLVPLIAFLVFAILNGRPGRDWSDRFRTAAATSANDAASSMPEPAAGVPEPAVSDPLGLQPASPPMTAAFVESTAALAESPAEEVAPAVSKPATVKPKPRRSEAEPSVVARENTPAAPWTVKHETRVTTSWTPPSTSEMGLVCGEVRDFDGRPVAGAQVEVSDAYVGVVADGAGRFCMSAPAGDRTLTVRAPGFVAQQSALRVGSQTAPQVITLSSQRR